MKIGMWSTDNNAEFMPLLMHQLDKEMVPYEISTGQKWVPGRAWEVRIHWMWTWAAKQKGTIMLLDPWDHAFLGTRESLEETISSFGGDVIWSAEHECWPISARSVEFPDPGSQYRYPNGGAIVGDAEVLEWFFRPSNIRDLGVPNYNQKGVYHPDGNQPWVDQVYFQDLYLQGVGVVDYKCKLFQTLVNHKQTDFRRKGDMIENISTGECPLFFHANGRAKFPDCVMKLIEEKL